MNLFHRILAGVGVVAVSWVLVTEGQVEAQQESNPLRATLIERAEHTVLTDRCGECHESEVQVWAQTAHATGFDTLHKRDSAKAIYRKLGLRVIKRGTEETTPACLQCHYTPVLRNEDQLRAGAGVSCESCHGPAADWITVHNDYGVQERDFQRAALLETDEHRTERIAASRAAGMQRPSDLYGVAANCFGCHTVPSEELVNVGGHSTGSDFELVEWSQGDIRHNFLESFKTADGTTNAERSPETKRVMYVVGRALDLEYSLRGVGAASVDDLYLSAMTDRASAAADNLLDVVDRAPAPEIQSALEVFNDVELRINNRAAIEQSADRIGALTRAFIARANGDELASLDPLWDPTVEDTVEVGERSVRAEPAPVLAPDTPGVSVTSSAATTPGDDAAVVVDGPPEPARVAGDVPVTPPPLRERFPVRQQPEWREDPAHAFVKKVPCGRCHSPQEKWWRSDPHSETARPFRQNDERYVAIATAYGVGADGMGKGNQICMWCHGTPTSSPTRDVRFGVGCQRCHGAGADYEERHEPEKGYPYAEALSFGLVDLKDANTRAGTCAGCHYITDPGLIAAGHESGSDFELVDRVDQIRHWGDEFGGAARELEPAALVAAHDRVIAARGPVPVVRVTLPPPAVASALAPPALTQADLSDEGSQGAPPAADPSDADRPPAVGPDGSSEDQPNVEDVDVTRGQSPPPAGTSAGAPRTQAAGDAGSGSNVSIEELLIDLKQRLEALYRRLDQ